MQLFEVLPHRFFTLFTGKNREIYAEAVLELYEQYKISRVGIDYEVMRDLFQEIIEVKAEAGIEFELEEGEPGELLEADKYRLQASSLLRKLQQLEWIDLETRDNFKKFIVLPHYSIRMLKVMKDLCEVRSVEFQSYALSTYHLLSPDGMEQQPSLAIFEAERVTEKLMEELRLLINNMKHQMEEVVGKQSLQEVLNHHFDIYMKNIVDRSYHRLKTSDHVARYRSRILETVQSWSLNQDLLNTAVKDAMKTELYSNNEEAEQKLQQALQFIEDTYENLDEIYEQIDIRHHQYLKASYDRARYLTQHNQGLDRQIATLLENQGGMSSLWEDFQQDAFRLQNVKALSESSLLTPRKKRAAHQPTQHAVIDLPEELKQKIRNRSIQKLENAITKQKVYAYILDHLGDRREMGIRELAPKNIEEYRFLPYVYLYGYESNSPYSLLRTEKPCILHIGDYRFVDRLVIRNR